MMAGAAASGTAIVPSSAMKRAALSGSASRTRWSSSATRGCSARLKPALAMLEPCCPPSSLSNGARVCDLSARMMALLALSVAQSSGTSLRISPPASYAACTILQRLMRLWALT